MTDPNEQLLDSITTLPNRIHTSSPWLLQTQIPTFRGSKDSFSEVEHLLQKHLRPMNHCIPDEAKIQYFQSLQRDKAIEFYQSLTTTTEANLNEVLTRFRKEFTKVDLRDVACYKWDEVNYDFTAKTLSDFLKRLDVFAKEAFQDRAGQYIQNFFFGFHNYLHKTFHNVSVYKNFRAEVF